MKNAKVAIITRTKNRIILLKRAIESVQKQTMTNWVMSIVNDGGNIEELDAYLSTLPSEFMKKVVVCHNEKSLGMEAASNVGIMNTNSEYVIIHDDDDSWDEKFLEKTVNYLDYTEFSDCKGVVTHSIRVIENIENEKVTILESEPFNTWMNWISLFRMAAGNTFPPISFLYRREVFDEIGMYDESLPVLGDWDFNLRFLEKYEIFVLHETLANYHHRVHMKNSHYANSVFGASGKHEFYDNYLRNKMLKKDIENNKIGLGILVNEAKSFEDLHGQIRVFEGIYEHLKKNKFARFIKKIL